MGGGASKDRDQAAPLQNHHYASGGVKVHAIVSKQFSVNASKEMRIPLGE